MVALETSHNSLRWRVWKLSITALAMILLLSCIVLFGIARAYWAMQRVHHAQEALQELRTYAQIFNGAESGQRGYLLTHDESYLIPYTESLRAFEGETAKLHALHIDDEFKERVDSMDAIFRAKLDELSQTIALARIGRSDQAIAIVKEGRGQRSSQQFWTTLRGASTHVAGLLPNRQAKSSRENLQIGIFLGVVGIASVLFFIFSARKTIIEIVDPLEALAFGMHRVSDMGGASCVATASLKEVDYVVAAFNQMAVRLELANVDRDAAESMLHNTNRQLRKSLREVELRGHEFSAPVYVAQ